MKKYGWIIAMTIAFFFLAFLQMLAKEKGWIDYAGFIGYLKLVPLFIFLKLIVGKK